MANGLITLDELMALPEIEPAGFSIVERVIDGRKVNVPKISNYGGLWREETDPYGFEDANGVLWDVGRIKGQLVRRRALRQ